MEEEGREGGGCGEGPEKEGGKEGRGSMEREEKEGVGCWEGDFKEGGD